MIKKTSRCSHMRNGNQKYLASLFLSNDRNNKFSDDGLIVAVLLRWWRSNILTFPHNFPSGSFTDVPVVLQRLWTAPFPQKVLVVRWGRYRGASRDKCKESQKSSCLTQTFRFPVQGNQREDPVFSGDVLGQGFTQIQRLGEDLRHWHQSKFSASTRGTHFSKWNTCWHWWFRVGLQFLHPADSSVFNVCVKFLYDNNLRQGEFHWVTTMKAKEKSTHVKM